MSHLIGCCMTTITTGYITATYYLTTTFKTRNCKKTMACQYSESCIGMCEWTGCPGIAGSQPLPLQGSQVNDAEPLPQTGPFQLLPTEPLPLCLTGIEPALPCSPMADQASEGKLHCKKLILQKLILHKNLNYDYLVY